MESIYKLSFYKKKNNWKFSKAEFQCNEPDPKPVDIVHHNLQNLECVSMDINLAEPQLGPPPDENPIRWTNSEEKIQDVSIQKLQELTALNSVFVEADLGEVDLMHNPDDVLDVAEQWLRSQSTTISDLVSFENFIRGASEAPHSSELDLLSLSEDEAVRRIAILSSQQLLSEVTRHTNALRLLLNEVRTRQQMRLCSQSMEYPQVESMSEPAASASTTLPSTTLPLSTIVRFVDSQTVAGAFEQDQPGKGRGRLRPRSGIIGIGKGRPFWL
ncbi:unnamed protein product [Chilo suppressalis]|uniref:Uncharacterized protein n=1 Tax=Chilo suppressalis TaxID=168631 RepID=A0ABN8L7C5_CHISP|nr:unnamed protein product [Chilo suppressalis]